MKTPFFYVEACHKWFVDSKRGNRYFVRRSARRCSCAVHVGLNHISLPIIFILFAVFFSLWTFFYVIHFIKSFICLCQMYEAESFLLIYFVISISCSIKCVDLYFKEWTKNNDDAMEKSFSVATQMKGWNSCFPRNMHWNLFHACDIVDKILIAFDEIYHTNEIKNSQFEWIYHFVWCYNNKRMNKYQIIPFLFKVLTIIWFKYISNI